MQYKLENENLIASFKEKGAEMCSLRLKKNGIEYVWGADPDVWNRHAPILFPVVGRLQDNQYRLNGKEFTLSQHGFARDLVWEMVGKEVDSLTFSLREKEETLQKFPFAFELRTIYSLEKDVLSITYQVQNNSKEEMPFSIGAHPGFNCPLKENEAYEDYYLEFEKPETLEKQVLAGGLRTGNTEPLLKNQKELPLSPKLFENDALVLERMASDKIALRSRKHSHGLEMNFKGFPYLGIWTKPGESSFICLEPWFGVADKTGGQEDIEEKEGIQLLPAGKAFSCTYSIRLF